jgi:hypothetical protein
MSGHTVLSKRFNLIVSLACVVAQPGISGWFTDRNNDMATIDISAATFEAKVGRAMATVSGLAGISQAMQVCPGVYLATAHGVLDDAERAGEQPREPLEMQTVVAPYPLSGSAYMVIRGNNNFSRTTYSPEVASEDFIFLRVDQALRPTDFVRLATISDVSLYSTEPSQRKDVKLYRGLPRYKTDWSGVPDDTVDISGQANLLSELIEVYQKPRVVTQPCRFHPIQRKKSDERLHHDCPVESSVSGSALIAEFEDEPVLVGIVEASIKGHPTSLSASKSNTAIPAKGSMCSTYKEWCGMPCIELK